MMHTITMYTGLFLMIGGVFLYAEGARSGIPTVTAGILVLLVKALRR
jgi:hypothetical protein